MPYVGEKDSFKIDVSNSILGLPLTSKWVFSELNSKALNKIAEEVAEQLTKKMGSKFIPGLNVVSCLAMLVSGVNQACGNNGFTVTVYEKYTKYVSPKDDYTVYGWDITGISIRTY